MKLQDILKEYRDELTSLFDDEESLLIHENKLMEVFPRQLQIFRKLDVSFKQEIIEQGKYIASVMMNGDEEEVTNLHMELILQQPEYLKEKLGNDARDIGEMLYPNIHYEKIGDDKEIGEVSISKLTTVWWKLQHRKFRLLDKYFEISEKENFGEDTGCPKDYYEDAELIELCGNYGKRHSVMLPEDVMRVLCYAKSWRNFRASNIIRAIQEDPDCSKTLREKSNKMEKRIRRVVNYYDKKTGNLRTYSSR